MIIEQFKAGDFEVTLYEYPENKKVMNRTAYTLRVQGKGTFIYNVSDEKEEAMQVYEKVVMYIVEGYLTDEERTLLDIVEYLN